MGRPLPGQAATAHGNGAVTMTTRATIRRRRASVNDFKITPDAGDDGVT